MSTSLFWRSMCTHVNAKDFNGTEQWCLLVKKVRGCISEVRVRQYRGFDICSAAISKPFMRVSRNARCKIPPHLLNGVPC